MEIQKFGLQKDNRSSRFEFKVADKGSEDTHGCFDTETGSKSETENSKKPKLIEYVQNAIVLINHGEYRDADRILKFVLSNDATHYVALKWYGRSLLAQNQNDEALAVLEYLVEHTCNADSLSILAEAYLRAGQRHHAKQTYLEIVDLNTEECEILFDSYKQLGNILLLEGDVDAAEEQYHKANRIFPDSDPLQVNYGTLELQRDQINMARRYFRRAIEINPNNDKGWTGLAIVHRSFGDCDLSWANLMRALDENPLNTTALNLAAKWSQGKKQWDEVVSRLAEYENLSAAFKKAAEA